jgi:dedicated sortase system histidine kinase
VSRPGLSIRTKVVLVSALLLTIPYVGYQYVREMENHLRHGLEQSVLGAAQALAGALNDRADLLPSPGDDDQSYEGEIYAHPLPQHMQIDGYVSDWGGHLSELRPLVVDEAGAEGFSAQYVVGKYAQYLYLLVVVKDDRVVYRGPEARLRPSSDFVTVATQSPGGSGRVFLLSTISAGWVTPLTRESGAAGDAGGQRAGGLRAESRIRAEWRETRDGYVVEARIPLSLLGERVAIEVGDVDSVGTRERARLVSTSGPGAIRRLDELVLPSESIEALIKSLGRTPGRRTWVIDPYQRVLARGGSLERDQAVAPINPLFALILRPPPGELFEEKPIVSHLSGPEVRAALSGRGASRWRSTSDRATFVISAAHPLWIDDRIAGAVVVEETTQGIQTVRRDALANLFTKTLLVFFFGTLFLLLFATRISVRLRRLRNETERAIDAHGRVVGTLSGSRAGDEIGDLARGFSAMMERLRQYNHYLEQLARRLSHELRTPIAVVRSSLDALELERPDAASDIYLTRARDGLRRLDAIITRMSEAARLEHALQDAECEGFDLCHVAAAAVDAYRIAWPNQAFDYQGTEGPCVVWGVPDLVVQLLDKLVANAVEFSRGDAPIRVAVTRIDGRLDLRVENRGPPLPAEMADKLFESMVSIRADKSDVDPHLGLGLYIVRLIAEFHEARAEALNLPDGGGVCMRVVFPERRDS